MKTNLWALEGLGCNMKVDDEARMDIGVAFPWHSFPSCFTGVFSLVFLFVLSCFEPASQAS